LEVRELRTSFFTDQGVVKAVDGVSFEVGRGEILGLVGESGCGKSVTSLSIMRLVASPGRIVGGQIIFDGRDLLLLSEVEMRKVRGNDISMIFQEPMTSLNPVHRIGRQIGEMLRIHRPDMDRREREERIIARLQEVSIPSPEQRLQNFPHQLSGGMRQRAMIAMALATGECQLLIADEPSTALDVTIQAQILDLIKRIQQETGMSVILVTHDLGVIAEAADRVAVMYAGSIVEYAAVNDLFSEPMHPYTHGLLDSLPQKGKHKRKETLYSIPGVVPNPLELVPGCKFANRCRYAKREICLGGEPPLEETRPNHWVRCARVEEIW
jgi:oligopeptide/dipeptide ABC transporter ATP-binding protein